MESARKLCWAKRKNMEAEVEIASIKSCET